VYFNGGVVFVVNALKALFVASHLKVRYSKEQLLLHFTESNHSTKSYQIISQTHPMMQNCSIIKQIMTQNDARL